MSELGYLTFPAYLPNAYLRYLHYAASDGRWKHADDFVLMWYASWGAGPDAQKCLSFTNSSGDQQLSTHGQHLLAVCISRPRKRTQFHPASLPISAVN